MLEKFRISVEITELDDGSIIVQQINPDGPISDFYGGYLGPGQIAKLGSMLLTRSPLFISLVEHSEIREQEQIFPKDVSELEKARRRWERIKPKLAPKVYARYGAACLECGDEDNLTIDHIVPLSNGGTNELDNLQPLCRSCNSRKGGR